MRGGKVRENIRRESNSTNLSVQIALKLDLCGKGDPRNQVFAWERDTDVTPGKTLEKYVQNTWDIREICLRIGKHHVD